MITTWNNKYILITGAGAGASQALARLFASKGAKLILTDIDADTLKAISQELGSAVLLFYCLRKQTFASKKNGRNSQKASKIKQAIWTYLSIMKA